MPRFSAHIGYLFKDRPLLERVDAAASAGFKAIEGHFPDDVPAEAIKRGIESNKAQGARHQYAAGSAKPNSASAPCRAGEKTGRRPSRGRSTTCRPLAAAPSIALPARSRRTSGPTAERVFVDNLKRAADQAAARKIRLLIEPINPRDTARLFSQPGRARRRHHRQGRQATNVLHPVRFLSHADRRRRHHRTLQEISAGDRASAMRRRCRRGTSRTERRDQLPLRFSRPWTGLAIAAGSAPSTGRAAAPRTGSAGRSLTAWCRRRSRDGWLRRYPRFKRHLTSECLEKPGFSAFRTRQPW